jgi:DNA-binding transcriptional LysR family regulator
MLTRFGLLATGHFLTILPRTTLHFVGSSRAFRRINLDVPVPTYPVGIITLKNRTVNPIARIFIEYAREVARAFIKTKT